MRQTEHGKKSVVLERTRFCDTDDIKLIIFKKGELGMLVKIYTDGAARGNPDGPGGYGTILHYTDPKGELHVREFCQGYAPRKCLLGGKGTENRNGTSWDDE